MIYSCRSRIFLTSLASATLIPSFHVSSFSLPSSTSFTQRNQPLGHDQSVTNHKLNLQSRQRQNEGVAFHASATAKNGTELLSTYVQSYSEHDVVTSVDIPLLKFIHEKDDPVVIDIERGLFSIQNSAKTLSIPEDLYGKKSAYRDKDVFVSSISDDLIISIPSSSSNVIKEDLKEKAVWVARMLLLLSAALYGTNFTMVKSLDESMSVGVSSTLRFGFAALSMLPWLFSPINEELKTTAKNNSYQKFISKQGFLFKMGDEPTRLSALLAGMEIGMWNSVGYIAQAEGLKTTSASKSAFICSMAVVTVPILDYMFGKELLRRQIIGACLAAFGVFSLEMGGQQGIESLTSGDISSLVQPVMFGLGFWRMEAAMHKYPTEAGRLAAAQLLMVFLVSLSYLISTSYADMPSATQIMTWLQDPNILGMLFWTGIVTTAFTIWMETLALKTLSAAETTLIFSTEPLFGAAFAAVVANECLGMDAVVGAAFIIGGCLVSGIDFGHFFRDKTPLKLDEEGILE